MSTHNIRFYGELTKIIFQFSPNAHLNCSSHVPKYLDQQVWANSVDPDIQEQSDQGLLCLPFHLHLLDALVYGKSYVA